MKKTYFKIIIPNYNNEMYLEKCLNSILNQSFQDFFIIVIDDMSTDKSIDILNNFKQIYPEKFDFIVQSKKSYQGICRNIGIEYRIDSKYTWFIDSDDYIIDSNFMQRLYQYTLEHSDFDMLYFDYYQEENSQILKKTTPELTQNIANQLLLFNGVVAPWARIYKTTRIDVRYSNKLFEDMLFMIQYLDKKHTYCKIPDAGYVYVQHTSSDSAKFRSADPIFKARYNDYLNELYEIYKCIQDKTLQQCIFRRLVFDQYLKIQS